MFGENMLVGAFSDEIYLPAGNVWVDYWSGKVYEGGQTITPELPENRGGFLFVRGGAILPTDEPRQHTEEGDTKHIILELYPHGASYYDFYEDDGMTLEYNDGKRAVTRISMVEGDGVCDIGIGEREGEFAGIGERVYTARVFAETKPVSVTVGGSSVEFDYDGRYVTFEVGKETEAQIVFG